MINKIKGLIKYTDCSMPSNEAERINKAEVSAYNQAIEDVVKLFAIPDVVGRSELLKFLNWYVKDEALRSEPDRLTNIVDRYLKEF